MSAALSPLPIVNALAQLEQLNQNTNLKSLIDNDLQTHNLPDALRKQIKRWDKLIYQSLLTHIGSPQFLQLSNLGEKIIREGKIGLLRSLAPTDSKLIEIIKQFEANLRLATASTLKLMRPTSFLGYGGNGGLGAIFGQPTISPFILAYPQLYNITKQPTIEEKYQKIFAKTMSSEELKKEFLAIEIENIPLIAKVLTVEQACELFSSSFNDNKMARRLAYLIVSLPHEIIEEILHRLADTALSILNGILKQVSAQENEELPTLSTIKSTPSFDAMFQNFREGFVKESNATRNQIDQLDAFFRDLKTSEITKEHLKKIDRLREKIEHRIITIDKLKLLIKGLGKAVFTRLSQQELPREYKTFLNRLSDDEEIIAKSSGTPYGYIYDKAFTDMGVTNDTSVSEIMELWGIDKSLEEKITNKGIFTVLNLKTKKIFNKRMLLEEIN